MARLICGVGTAHFGCYDISADRSFKATEWLTIFYLPVIPIRSVRIHDAVTEGVIGATVFTKPTTRYSVSEVGAPSLGHVIRVYCYMGLLPMLLLAGAVMGDVIEGPRGSSTGAFIGLMAWIWVFLYARKREHRRAFPNEMGSPILSTADLASLLFPSIHRHVICDLISATTTVKGTKSDSTVADLAF